MVPSIQSGIPNDQRPTGWGCDELSRFIEDTQKNTFASFDQLREEYALLSGIDQVFHTLADENLINTNIIVSGLFIHAHSVFRSAVRLILSGQPPAGYMALRGCIETALYSFYINGNAESANIWLNRHVDDHSRELMKRTFTYGNVKRFLLQAKPDLSQVTDDLYEKTIDFGAHPNEMALTTNMQIQEIPNGTRFQIIYLHGISHSLLHAIIACMEVGLCVLDIYQLVYSERFAILGLSDRMSELRTAMPHVARLMARRVAS